MLTGLDLNNIFASYYMLKYWLERRCRDLRMSPFSCCWDERQIFRISDFNCGLQGYVQLIEFIIELLNINIRNPDLNL